MRSACYRIVWGLFLVLADLRVEFVDILPDSLGYLLIASGLWQLQRLNGYFKAGHLCAWLLLIWSILQLFWYPDAEIGSVPMHSVIDLLPHLLASAVHIVLIYGICRGIQAYTAGVESGLDQQARFRLHMFMTVQLLWLFIHPFLLNLDSNVMIPVVFVCSLLVMIAEIAILLLVRLFARQWTENME